MSSLTKEGALVAGGSRGRELLTAKGNGTLAVPTGGKTPLGKGGGKAPAKLPEGQVPLGAGCGKTLVGSTGRQAQLGA